MWLLLVEYLLMTSHLRFVQLDRRFRKLDPDEKPENAALRSYTTHFSRFARKSDWNDLLKNRVVILLGEPGSGKTWELKEQARRLNDEGSAAFFVRLDRLTTEPLETVLGKEDSKRLREWLSGDVQGTFFLDSVDEAKFHRAADFSTALDRFREAIGNDDLSRLRLVISSRISEWRPYSDAHEVHQRFHMPPPQSRPGKSTIDRGDPGEHNDQIVVVQLEPLDRDRVVKFAEAMGLIDSAGFVKALDAHHAWDFAHRPIDVVDLISFWSENKRLGSLSELIEFDLAQKLQETAEREAQDRLDEGRAREGAETLAAAVAFCRQFSFCVRDDSDLSKGNALDAYDCLPEDWKPGEVRALLARGLFDSASYGRIRFHHRRVAEYLAARWLAKRMKEGCPTEVLEDLLFTQENNRRVIRSAMAPVTAWLACGEASWNHDIRQWLLEAAPSVLLQYGDSSTLPIEYKRKILQALVARAKGRDQVWIDTNAEALSRLAEQDLSDDIKAILRDRNVARDLRNEFLQLVRHGRLLNCLDVALEIIASPDEDERIKFYAALAIRDIGDISHRRQLAAIAPSLSKMSSMFCGVLCESIYPDAIDAVGLGELLRKADRVRAHAGDLPYCLKNHFEEVVTPDESSTLLEQLINLAMTPPFVEYEGKPTPVSDQFRWMEEVMPTVLAKLLSKPQLSEYETRVAAEALWLPKHLREFASFRHDLPADFDSLAKRHPTVRQHYFWRVVDDWRRENTENPKFVFQLFNDYEICPLVSEDFDWLLDDVGNRPEQIDRELALIVAISIWYGSPRRRQDRRRLVTTVKQGSSLLSIYRERMSGSRFTWLRRQWYRHVRQKLAKRYWWRMQRSKVRNAWNRVRDTWFLWRHVRQLRSGAQTNWLAHLADEAESEDDSDRGHHLTPHDWSALQAVRGKLIASAAKEGCKRAWRRFEPPLPHEKTEPSSIDNRVIVGLAGIQAAIDDGDLSLSQLVDDEVRIASHYAVNELNGFASWFPQLADHNRGAVARVLNECVRGEWEFPIDRERVHEVIHDLTWHGDGLFHLVEDSLFDQLRIADPENVEVLRLALNLAARKSNRAIAELRALAPQRIKQYGIDSDAFMYWLAVWLQVDAVQAIEFVGSVSPEAFDEHKAMERLCYILSGERRANSPLIANPSYAEPTNLRLFIPLVYRYLRPSDDIIRGSGSYSPTARDEAQRFRNGLLDRLAESDVPGVTALLNELSVEPELQHARDWILHLKERHVAQHGNAPPWTAADLRGFAKDYEVDPKTDDDLFKIACRRLTDIKRDVEKSDNSLRDELHPDDDEFHLRRWLARKLIERSRNRYTVPQEAEIDQRQRPDLRIENPKTPSVPIEIKWADGLRVLLERLENQLVGQYLRAHDSRYGIYCVGCIGDRRYWIDESNNRRIGFDDVLEALNEKARSIEAAIKDVAGIAIIGIDFRDPRTMT